MDVDFGKVINKNQLLGWRWAPLCDAVRRSPVLSDGAKILYNEIISFIWQKDAIRAWPSQNTLGENLSVSRQAISRRSKELEAVGLIGVKRNGLGKSSDIYLYDLDMERLQVEQDDTGAFHPIQRDAGEAREVSTPPSDGSLSDGVDNTAPEGSERRTPKDELREPVVTPDVTLGLHQDVTALLHQDVTQGSHLDVTSAPGISDIAEASGSDVAEVCADDVSAEEETGKIINREEEAAPVTLNSPTTLGSPKPNLSTIQRGDIPTGVSSTWNPALTEESVVIDGERFLVMDDEETVDVGTEVPEIEPELPDPETEVPLCPTPGASPDASPSSAGLTVEAETSDEEATVNREKMAKLVSGIGEMPTTEADVQDGDVAPLRLSREEMRVKLLEMDWRDGIDGETDDEV